MSLSLSSLMPEPLCCFISLTQFFFFSWRMLCGSVLDGQMEETRGRKVKIVLFDWGDPVTDRHSPNCVYVCECMSAWHSHACARTQTLTCTHMQRHHDPWLVRAKWLRWLKSRPLLFVFVFSSQRHTRSVFRHIFQSYSIEPNFVL